MFAEHGQGGVHDDARVPGRADAIIPLDQERLVAITGAQCLLGARACQRRPRPLSQRLHQGDVFLVPVPRLVMLYGQHALQLPALDQRHRKAGAHADLRHVVAKSGGDRAAEIGEIVAHHCLAAREGGEQVVKSRRETMLARGIGQGMRLIPADIEHRPVRAGLAFAVDHPGHAQMLLQHVRNGGEDRRRIGFVADRIRECARERLVPHATPLFLPIRSQLSTCSPQRA